MGRTCYICGSFVKPLFEFPQDRTERKKWIKVLQNSFERKLDYKTAVLCTRHFSPDSLDYSRRTCKLNPGAIPLPVSVDEDNEVKNDKQVKKDKYLKNNRKEKNDIEEERDSEEKENNGKSKDDSAEVSADSESTTDTSTEETGPELADQSTLFPEPVKVLTEAEKIKLLTGNSFVFAIPQVPRKLTSAVQEAIQIEEHDASFLEKTRVHCTVCQKHIGAAPIAQIDRYMHPDINTLLCEACFLYHGSGEFTKDEDGSEIYCKWCAQGGTVMCCSDCPLVFCQQCVRNNLGAKRLKEIEDLEDWKCFKCDPIQLSHLQAIGFILHRYTIKQITKILQSNTTDLLKQDITKCCNKPPRKRKKSNSDDENDEFLPSKYMRKSTLAKTPLLNKEEIVQPTGVQIVNKAVTSAVKLTLPIQPKPTIRTIPLSSLLERTLLQSVRPVNIAPITSTVPALSKLIPNLPNMVNNSRMTTVSNQNPTEPSTSVSVPLTLSLPGPRPILAPRMPGVPGIIRMPGAPPRGLVPIAPKGTPTAENAIRVRMISTKQVADNTKIIDNAHLVKTSWLMNSVSESKTSFQRLCSQAEEIQKEAKLVKTHGQLAGLHNRMQHAMSKCTNALIETRKKMHRDFLEYLSKMNVSHSSFAPNGNIVNNIPTGVRLAGTMHIRPPLQRGFPPTLTRLQKVPRPRAIIYPPPIPPVRPVSNAIVVNKHPILITKSTPQLIMPKTTQPVIMAKPIASLMPAAAVPSFEKDPLALDEEQEIDPAILQPEITMHVDAPIVESEELPFTIKTEKIDEDDDENMTLKL